MIAFIIHKSMSEYWRKEKWIYGYTWAFLRPWVEPWKINTFPAPLLSYGAPTATSEKQQDYIKKICYIFHPNIIVVITINIYMFYVNLCIFFSQICWFWMFCISCIHRRDYILNTYHDNHPGSHLPCFPQPNQTWNKQLHLFSWGWSCPKPLPR